MKHWDKVFYSYGYDEERSKVLYYSFEQPLLDIFQGTAFKKHVPQLIEEKKLKINQNFSFSYLRLLIGRKEYIIFFCNVNLHPIDCPYDDFVNYSTKIHSLLPHYLDSGNTDEKEAAREIVQNFLKHVAEISNLNLIQNANSLMAKNEVKTDTGVDFSWVSDVHLQNQTKFKLGYYFFRNELCYYCSNIETYFATFTVCFLVLGFEFFCQCFM